MYVEYILNRQIPSLQWRTDDEVLILDTWRFMDVGVVHTLLSINDCQRSVWDKADYCSDNRIKAFVTAVKSDKSLRLVETAFYNREVDTIVLALVKTHHQESIAVGKRRYEIVNSVFRVA